MGIAYQTLSRYNRVLKFSCERFCYREDFLHGLGWYGAMRHTK